MKTKTHQVCTFDELSEQAKQHAIEKHREFTAQEWEHDCTTDDAKNVFKSLGFAIGKIYFSGFSSQGDGACFEGSWHASDYTHDADKSDCPVDAEYNRIAAALGVIAKQFPFASLTVTHRGHYSHEYCTDFTVSIVDENSDDITTDEAVKAEKDLIKLSRDAMRWIYKSLEKDFEYQTADEQIIENIKANEYEFTTDGNLD